MIWLIAAIPVGLLALVVALQHALDLFAHVGRYRHQRSLYPASASRGLVWKATR